MKIGVTGCAGRMGRMLVAEVIVTEGAELAGGTEQPGSEYIGADLASLAGYEEPGHRVTDDAAELFADSDVVLDFTAPAATVAHAELAAETGVALVVGTTGLGTDDMQALARAAERTAIVQAGNMSLGVNLLLGLTERAAAVLGAEYDVEVVEMHHRHKVDAPSGTALMLGAAAAAGRGVDLEAVSDRGRDGHTGERAVGRIGFASLRGGDVFGDHSVVFAGPGERIELTHKASSRNVFATGAVRAALWCAGNPPGLYSMRDVLDLT